MDLIHNNMPNLRDLGWIFKNWDRELCGSDSRIRMMDCTAHITDIEVNVGDLVVVLDLGKPIHYEQLKHAHSYPELLERVDYGRRGPGEIVSGIVFDFFQYMDELTGGAVLGTVKYMN